MKYTSQKTAFARRAPLGFTLIELMIVLAVGAILTSIAIPYYRNHVTKNNRAAAESFMLNLANKQEQYRLDARTFATSLAALGVAAYPPGVQQNYTVTITNATSTTYTITGAPIGSQLAGDTLCGTVTLDQTGAKTPASNCW